MTPSERAALKAEMLREIQACSQRAYNEDGPMPRELLRRAAELEAEAARDRVASVDQAPSLPSTAPSSETPEARREGDDSGGRPAVKEHVGFINGYAVPVACWHDHKRLVAWLDADREKKSKRIVDLETELAMARHNLRLADESSVQLKASLDAAVDIGLQRNAATAELEKRFAERDKRIVDLETELAMARQEIAGRKRAIDSLGDVIAERDERIVELEQCVEKTEADAAVLRRALEGITAKLPCRPCPESPSCELGLAQTCQRRAAALATGAGEKLLADHRQLQSECGHLSATLSGYDKARAEQMEQTAYLQAEVEKLRAFVAAFDQCHGVTAIEQRFDEAIILMGALKNARAALDGLPPSHGGQDGGAS